MPRLRRFASVLFLPLAFQLVLAAKAVACVGPNAASASTDTRASMPGMDMPTAATGDDAQQSNHSTPSPCDRPFSQSGCQPLAACASGALAATTFFVAPVAPLSHAIVTLVVLAPTSRSTRPELPPPRA